MVTCRTYPVYVITLTHSKEGLPQALLAHRGWREGALPWLEAALDATAVLPSQLNDAFALHICQLVDLLHRTQQPS